MYRTVELQEFIEDIRGSLEEIFGGKGEMAVRQGIIDPLLRSLGWDTTNIQIVYPEYGVGGGRVDYALCYPLSEPRVFIEAKALGEIDKAEEQLFRYDSYIRVPIAVATDGQKWIFFHPTGRGTRSERKVRELDLTLASSEESAKCLEEYLSYEAIQTGEADESIRRDYENLVSHRKVENHLPGAWENLLEKEDELLLEIVADAVKGLCGHTPTNRQVLTFLKNLEVIKPPPPITPPVNGDDEIDSRLRAKLNGASIVGNTSSETFTEVIESIGIERVRNLNLIRSGIPLISPIKDWRGTYHPKRPSKCGKYYITTQGNPESHASLLEKISDSLPDISLEVKVMPRKK